MKYIQNKADMVMKYKAIYDLLSGQVKILDGTIKRALAQYQEQGGDDRHMIEAFFAMIEAAEKATQARQILAGGEHLTELSKFIQNLKDAFRRLDMAVTDIEDSQIARAVEEAKTATIH